eukprot:gene125-124_t
MYNLFSRVPSTLDLLRDAMCDYAKECGFAILTEQDREKDQVKFVQQLLDLKVKFDDIVNESFGGEKKAHKKLREAFEEFINKDTRCASYLSLYIDELLKAGLRGLSESDAETQLDRVISIFRFLQDKDIFEVFYRTQLSKRLLNGRTSSDEYERTMVAKLKAECGYQFTAKLEGMFTDMKISKTAMETFKVSDSFRKLEIELDVCVLTTGYWPINAPTLCNLPGVMQDAIDKFSEYYLVSYNGRKLTWLPNLGTVDIKAVFACGMRELTVSTYQACILMLFNDPQVATLTLDQIRNSSQIPEADLKRHLLSLCTPKFKILVKSSKSRGIAEDDTFCFNVQFASKYRRVKVPLISTKETSAAHEEAAESVPGLVEEDRRHLVEAAVVRVMKARRSLSHNELVGEVVRQLTFRFNPNPQFIKKRIESLIEREYLARDKDDRRLYTYQA